MKDSWPILFVTLDKFDNDRSHSCTTSLAREIDIISHLDTFSVTVLFLIMQSYFYPAALACFLRSHILLRDRSFCTAAIGS